MYRTVIYFGLVVAAFCFLGLAVPQSVSALTFLLPDGWAALVNLALAAVLLDFGVAAYFRLQNYKKIFGFFGAFWTLLAFLGFFHPTYFGVFEHYARPADLVMMLIAGIGYMLAALEYDRPSLAEELKLLYQTSALVSARDWRRGAKKRGAAKA